MRGARQVGARREVGVHPKVASPLKVFPQDLGALLLVDQSSSRGSEVGRAVEVMTHQAKLLADSRRGGGRGRCWRVMRGGCCSCGCNSCSPLCLQKALMLEQADHVVIGA